jgi:tetratricopeptide (TPR) repeat protein
MTQRPVRPQEPRTPRPALRKSRLASWALPIAVVIAVAAGVWWFVFRPQPEERATKLLDAAGAAMRQRDFVTAEAKLRKALEIAPDNGILLHNLGVLYLEQNQLVEARAAFEKAAATHGPQANQVMAEDLYQLATISYAEKKWDQTASELERAIAADPTRAQLHARLLDLQLRRLDDAAAADSTQSRFLRLCGRTAGNLEAAAFVFYQNEVWDRAETLARDAVALADSQATAHALVARSMWRQGRAGDSLRYLDGPLARYPGRAELWIAQGTILNAERHRTPALAAADRAVAIAPRDIEAHDLRRHVLANFGRYQEALQEIEIAVGLTDDPGRREALKRDARRLRGILAASGGTGVIGGAAPGDTARGGGGPPP